MIMRYVVAIALLSSAITHAAVQQITTSAQFDGILKNNNVVVAKFGAEWCGPCRASKPKFQDISNRFNSIPFVEIDVDRLSDIADRYNVSGLPTFIIFQNGRVAERFTGADRIGMISEKLNRIGNFPKSSVVERSVAVERPIHTAGNVVRTAGEGARDIVETTGEAVGEVGQSIGDAIRSFFGW